MLSKMAEQRLISSMFSRINRNFPNFRHLTSVILAILGTNLLKFLIFMESMIK
jgi:hypothetical protein